MPAPAASAALQAAAIQDGLAQLMADLVQAEQTLGLPAPVQAAIVQILDFRSPVGSEPTAADVKEALTNSGLFSEGNAASDIAGAQSNPARTDMKTALLVLQQALKTWLAATPAADPASAKSAAPKLPQIPGADPLPPNRSGQPVDTKLPIATRFAPIGLPPADPQGIAKVPQIETQIPASSQSPASSDSTGKLKAAMEVPLAFAAAEAASDVSPHAPVPAPPQPAPPPAVLPQATAQTYATPTPVAVPEPSLWPANAPPAAYRGAIAPDAENVLPPQATPLPGPAPAFAAKAPAPGFVSSQAGPGAAPPPGDFIAAAGEGGPEGSAATNTAASNFAPQTDMKSALLVLQQIVKTSLAIASSQAYASATAKNPTSSTTQPQAESSPPPYRGAPTSAQRSLPASLPADADAHLVGEVLIKRTDAALAHMKLLQLASLPDAPEGRQANQPAGPRWMFEIPFATPQGSTIAQFQISRDAKNNADERTGPVWRARFSLDIEPIGPVHAQVALVGERAWVTLWAEREEGVQSLRAKESLLSKSLKDCDFAAEIAFCLGTPQRRVATAGRFLDRAS